MFRSILGVGVGFLIAAILTAITMVILEALFPGSYNPRALLPSSGWAVLNLIYTFVYLAGGGYVTALIAGRSEVKQALIMGGMTTVFGLLTFVASLGVQPLWYQLTLVLIPLPATWLGGRVRLRRKEANGQLSVK